MSRKYWYLYNGANAGEGAISNYTLVSSVNCYTGDAICEIYAVYGGDIHPLSISANLASYINLAQASDVGEPRGFKLFVYTRPS